MNVESLVLAMPGISRDRAAEFLPGLEKAMRLAGCTTPKRAAMFLAQIGEESVSMRYTEEIASGEEYNGRSDLGNTQPGDGPRFKGRGLIQTTGRNNYGAFSRWAHARGLVPTPTWFVDHPERLADLEWASLSAAWYWIGSHPHNGMMTLNDAADRGDVYTATLMVNGGTNGLSDREWRYNHLMGMGDSILPGAPDVWEEVMAFYKDRAEFEHSMARIVRENQYLSEFNKDENGNRRTLRWWLHGIPGFKEQAPAPKPHPRP